MVAAGHIHPIASLQDVNTPDFETGVESDITLGMENSLLTTKRFTVSIPSVAISAFIFLLILAWFDFMQSAFYDWSDPQSQEGLVSSSSKLWYAILVSIVVIILILLIKYYY